MAWTAEVTVKQVVNDVYHVTVEYTDGTYTHTETYKSRQPTADWIPDTAAHKIKQLEELYAYDVSVGSVTPSVLPAVDLNQQLFQRRARMLPTIKCLIDMGVVPADNAKVVQLTNWLKDNFAAYFESL